MFTVPFRPQIFILIATLVAAASFAAWLGQTEMSAAAITGAVALGMKLIDVDGQSDGQA